MQRPTGVTVIAVIMFLGAAYGVVLTLGVAGGYDPESIAPQLKDFPFGKEVLQRIAIFSFLFSAAISLLLGLGLWHRKNWARIITIVLSSLGIAMNAIGALGAALMAEDAKLALGLLGLGYNVWVVWYLVQPQVKLAFAYPPAPSGQAGSTPLPPSPPSPPSPTDPSEQP